MGSADIVVAKLDTNGALVWIKQQASFNTSGVDATPIITVDSNGNLFILYTTQSTVSGGTFLGSNDIVIMRMDTNGNIVWIKQSNTFNTTLTDYVYGLNDIALDSSGNIYVLYDTTGVVPGDTNLGSGTSDIVIMKLSAVQSSVAPSGITLDYSKYNRKHVQLSWISRNDATTINVYRDTQISGATKTLVGTSSTLTFTDTSNLVRGTTYYYFLSGTLNSVEGPLSSAYIFNYDTVVTMSWIKQLALMNTTAAEAYASIAYDSSGNIYISYISQGTISGGTLRGGYDVVVAKMDSNGNVIWIKQHAAMNTTVNEYNVYMALDSSSNIYVVYDTTSTVSGGSSLGSADIVITKLDTNGNILWIKQGYGSSGADSNFSVSLYDTSLFIAIRTAGSVSGGSNAGGNDIALHKVDLNGNLVWSRQQGYNTSLSEDQVKIFAASNGSVYMTYYTPGTISGGTTSGGGTDIVVTKIDTNGNNQWIKQYPAMNTRYPQQNPHIVVDTAGNAYIVYTTSATVSSGTSFGNSDIVFAKLDTNGALVWIKQQTVFNTIAAETTPSLAIDSDANIYATFLSAGTISGGTKGSGNQMVFMKMDSNGNVVWTREELVANSASASSTLPRIVVDASYNIVISYYVGGTVSGGTYLGSSDVVVMKYAQQIAPASASQAVTLGAIATYINAQTVTTDADKAAVSIDMRNAIKNATYANNAAKAADQKAYIDAMRTKVGASSYIVPEANFNDFKSTFSSSASGLTPKPIMVYIPAYTDNTASVSVADFANSNYLHLEIPVTYSITIQNGVDSITLTYDGTKFIDSSEVEYLIGDAIIIGSKTLTIIGFGSGDFNITNTGEATCMVKGTLITTPSGEQPIETLSKGDLVITGNGVKAPITNIHKIVIVRANDTNAPYIIKKNAFSPNNPGRDMCVSPRHAIQLRPGLWEIPREAAKENPNVCKDTNALNKRVIYYHFSLPNYETDTIIANGQITECLNDGSVKESYVWNAEEKGYTRTIQRIDNKLSKSA